MCERSCMRASHISARRTPASMQSKHLPTLCNNNITTRTQHQIRTFFWLFKSNILCLLKKENIFKPLSGNSPLLWRGRRSRARARMCGYSRMSKRQMFNLEKNVGKKSFFYQFWHALRALKKYITAYIQQMCTHRKWSRDREGGFFFPSSMFVDLLKNKKK